MKGFRVVPLTSEGKIPDEVGEIHHFSCSLERAKWWADRLPMEDDQFVPSSFIFGYAIVEVEVDDNSVQEDRFFPGGEDLVGMILSARPVIICRYETT